MVGGIRNKEVGEFRTEGFKVAGEIDICLLKNAPKTIFEQKFNLIAPEFLVDRTYQSDENL